MIKKPILCFLLIGLFLSACSIKEEGLSRSDIQNQSSPSTHEEAEILDNLVQSTSEKPLIPPQKPILTPDIGAIPVAGGMTYGGGGGGNKHSRPTSHGCHHGSCNDHNPCTIDECINDVCVYSFDEHKTSFGSCEVDGNGCTAGKCVNVADDIYCYEQNREFLSGEVGCQDDNPCTADSCVASAHKSDVHFDRDGNAIVHPGQCIYEIMEGAPCDVDEPCKEGICTVSGDGNPGDDYAISCVSSVNLDGPFGSECTTNYVGICAAGVLQCIEGEEVANMCVPMFRPGDKQDDCFAPNGLDDNCDGHVDECNCPAIPLGATYRYVSKSGTDSGDCSNEFAPCLTVNYAVSQAVSNDVIFIGPGTFQEGTIFVNVDLQFRGAGAGISILDGSNLAQVFNIQSKTSLCGLTITGGFTSIDGGGILADSDTTIVKCTIQGNFARSTGGGILARNSLLKVGDSTVSQNSVGAQGFGGGIYVFQGTGMVVNSTISENTSAGGGGIYSLLSSVSLTNSTVSSNVASILGGGILADIQSAVSLSLTTVTNNSSPNGAGVDVSSFSTISVYTSIIANQAAGQDCLNAGGTISSLGYNIESSTSCGFTNTGDQQNTDPKLGPLQNNGGPTKTHALATNSPAIDAGQASCGIATDQRGEPRPVDYPGVGPVGEALCDVGAYELQP